MKEWIGGRNPVYEVLRANRRDVFRLMMARGIRKTKQLEASQETCLARKIPIERVERERLDQLSQEHQGVLLEAGRYPYAAFSEVLENVAKSDEPAFLLLLDAIQDPQNLGSLLRTAELVGVHGVVLPRRRTATVTPAVVRASAGASEHLLIVQTNLAGAIKQLKMEGVWVTGLEETPGSVQPHQVPMDAPMAFVVGNEGTGIRRLVRESCDFVLRLPMRGRLDSLNAAVAGSVALYIAWQARGFCGARRWK